MDRSYRVNHIFYSLQGEGYNTGRAAVFVRFAGCNLHCPFCDTQFDTFQLMSSDDILQAIAPYPTRFIVLTGGEPTLQADDAFVDQLHQHGYEVAMESNGTRPAPRNIDWLTLSPKSPILLHTEEKGKMPDEIKIVFTTEDDVEQLAAHLPLSLGRNKGRLYLQPCDTGDPIRNAAIMQHCVDYIKQHPLWRLSLQTHKLIGIE